MRVASSALLLLCGLLLVLARPAAAAESWQWPLDPPRQVVRGFDPPETPYGRGHRGVDLASAPGAVVRAAGAGRIGYAGMLAGRGVVTVIHAGGLKTTYEPVAASVTAGTRVERGDVLGHLQAGHPRCPVAACLHWGLRRGAEYLDPLSLVGAERVRLLPLGTPPSGLPVAESIGAGLVILLRRRARPRSSPAEPPDSPKPPESPGSLQPPESLEPPESPQPPESHEPPNRPGPSEPPQPPESHEPPNRPRPSEPPQPPDPLQSPERAGALKSPPVSRRPDSAGSPDPSESPDPPERPDPPDPPDPPAASAGCLVLPQLRARRPVRPVLPRAA
ncbi:MAG TPA: M23 family metallopeptidase [Mycobacteriales bacterium]|nr:M23 family metallopeptidase [Mycobacteriales bacterium]